MKNYLISILLLSTVYAEGPLNNYGFDAVYKDYKLHNFSYNDYLSMLKEKIEFGLERQSDEHGSIIGGALATNDKADFLQKAEISDYRNLFEELDRISCGFIANKNEEDIENGIESDHL